MSSRHHSKRQKKKHSRSKSQGVVRDRVLVEAEWLPADVDPLLLDNAKIHWQFGDWEALAAMSSEAIEAHPEKATLAMLSAAAYQQLGQLDKTRDLMRLARTWGASRAQVVKVMAAGVHNVLARITALNHLDERAIAHYENALSFSDNSVPSKHLVRARAASELEGKIPLSELPSNLMPSNDKLERNGAPPTTENHCRQAQIDWCKGNWQALSRLETATLPEHPQRILLGIYAASGHQQLGDGDAEQRCTKAVLSWGGEKAKIKRFLLSGIYNRLGKANAYAGDYDEAISYFRKSMYYVLPDISGTDEYLKDRVESQLKDLPKDDLRELLSKL